LGTTYNEVDDYTLRVDENNFKPKKQEDTKSVVFCFGYDA
jgi:hypothetical protein